MGAKIPPAYGRDPLRLHGRALFARGVLAEHLDLNLRDNVRSAFRALMREVRKPSRLQLRRKFDTSRFEHDLKVDAEMRIMPYSTTIAIGGDRLVHEIIGYLRRRHNLVIAEAAAESLKQSIGCCETPKKGLGRTAIVRGHVPFRKEIREIEVSQAEIAEAVSEPVASILMAVRTTIERTAADVVDAGITLTGGGVMLEGMAAAIQDYLGLPVEVAADPLLAGIRGAGQALEDEVYRGAFFLE